MEVQSEREKETDRQTDSDTVRERKSWMVTAICRMTESE